MGANDVKFESVIQMLKNNFGSEVAMGITDIHLRDNMTYFTVLGNRFQTFGCRVIHERSPLFNHPVTLINAKQENDPEGIQEAQDQMKEMDEAMCLWDDYRGRILAIVFRRALECLEQHGVDKMLEFIDETVYITDGDVARLILKALKNE